jgi:hypothetical protein
MANPWHKEVLIKNTKEVFTSAVPYAIFGLVLLLWRFALGIPFVWVTVTPLSEPEFFYRAFYSAFTFLTLGRGLYYLGFYKLVHDIIVKGFGMWGLYNLIKAVVWAGLMFVSYQYIVPAIFTVLNTSATILYNVAALVLYTLPPIGISLILTAMYFVWKKGVLKHYFTK